jgi:NAD(P) transhydrogenase subunit alpha
MLAAMRPGSVVVDLAAEGGGNTELTRAGAIVDAGGTRVVGVQNAPSAYPSHASALFARNVVALLELLAPHDRVDPDWNDEIVAGCGVIREGQVLVR